MSRPPVRSIAAMLTLLSAAAPAIAAAPAPVPPPIVTFPGPGGIALRARLVLPAGPPVAPAIVALHGCGGPYPARDFAWARRLSARGHAVLLPDSFGSRGLGSQCRVAHRRVTPGGLRRQDALAAVRWLAGRPFAPPGGVALLGWSNGGSTVLAAGRAAPDAAPGLIRGLVAFYPGCGAALARAGWRPAAPLLILIGADDDWVSPAACRALAAGFPGRITVIAYPGAYHDFDVPDRPVRTLTGLAFSARGSGVAHVGTDPAARADALRRVPAFLAALPPAPAANR
jgi:dienelactone hydrolase